jgi:hypothetical protein
LLLLILLFSIIGRQPRIEEIAAPDADSNIKIQHLIRTRIRGADQELEARAFFRRPVDAPVVDSISPNAGKRGTMGSQVTLKGLNLKPEATVNLGPGVEIVEAKAPNPNTLELTIRLDPDAPVGPRDVSLSLPGQEPSVLRKAFTVIP